MRDQVRGHEYQTAYSDAELETLQRDTFGYFIHEANPSNGLVRDKTKTAGRLVSPLPGSRWPPIPLVSSAEFGRATLR